MIARFRLAPHPPVHVGVDEARSELLAQQQVIDLQPRIAAPVIPEVIPERIDALLEGAGRGARRTSPGRGAT